MKTRFVLIFIFSAASISLAQSRPLVCFASNPCTTTQTEMSLPADCAVGQVGSGNSCPAPHAASPYRMPLVTGATVDSVFANPSGPSGAQGESNP